MLELQIGDFIVGSNGQKVKVCKKFQPKVNGHYLITLDTGETIKTCKDHLWTLFKETNIRELKKLSNKITCDSQYIYDNFSKKEFHIQTISPLQYKEQNLKIDPYAYGLFLGDGSVHSGLITSSLSDFEEYKVYLESKEYVIKKYIKSTGENTCNFRISENYVGWGKKEVCGNILRRKVLNISDKVRRKKIIPLEYLFSSFDQRLELLKGLMDTDGYVSKNGKIVEFYNTEEDLVKQVELLCKSFGFKTTIRQKQGKYRDKEDNIVICKICYILTFKPTFQVFRLNRKAERLNLALNDSFYLLNSSIRTIVSIEQIDDNPDDYYCITVDSEDSLFAITDSFILTHNTIVFQLPTLLMEGTTLVVSPLLALQADMCADLERRGIKAAAINSTTGKKETKKIQDSLQDKSLKLLYMAPETLLKQNDYDEYIWLDFFLTQCKINHIVLDERSCCC